MNNEQGGPGGGAGLVRRLGPVDCILLVVGCMIGTGIFLTTGEIAKVLPSPALIFAAWIAGGVFALTGALTYGELGACFPRAGGHYAYMREAYGPLWGFLDGWLASVVTFPCAIGFMSLGLAHYLAHFVPFFDAKNVLFQGHVGSIQATIHGGHVPALGAVILLTTLNALGLQVGRLTQNILTVLKVGLLLGITALGLWFVRGSPAVQPQADIVLNRSVLMAIAGALIGISFAYLGWDASTYMGAESRNPQRTLPVSLLVGTVFVVGVYLLFNLFLVRTLPVSRMAGVPNVAVEAATVALGGSGAAMVTVTIALCILGAMNAAVMVAPRIWYAMAEDGLFFHALGRVHPRFRVPSMAVVAQGVWTCLILITGTFVSIMVYSIFAVLLISIAGAVAVVVLRIRRPDLPRPYRTWGYPVVPAIFALGNLGIAVNALFDHPIQCAWSLVAAGVGLVAYLFWRFRRPRTAL